MSKKFCAVTCCFVLMLVPLLLCGNSNATSDTDVAPENVLKSPETILSIDSKVGSPTKYRPIPHMIGRGTMISEGFEGAFPPAGWDTVSVPGGSAGGSCPIPWHPDANYAYSGTFGAAYGWGYNLDGWVRILNLDFSLVTAATISWWWESSFYWSVDPNDNADLFIEVSTDAGVTWDTLWTFGDSADVVNSGVTWPWGQFIWEQSTLSLDAYAGQSDVYVGFRVVADDNADIAIDDVLIDTTALAGTHDVGVEDIVSPPAGPVTPGGYNVIGHIHNYGDFAETFDVIATVWDTTGWTTVFGPTTLNLTSFPAGGDTNLDFGLATFGATAYYYTQIYTALAGDENTANDTDFVFSQTALALGDIIYELDVQTPTGDNQLLGCEFDGTYFYVTGGASGTDPNKVYVFDTLGTLIWTLDQPGHSTGWGWRDLAFDDAYADSDRVDTLYASVNANVDYFGIDLTGGSLDYYGNYPGAQNPNRALAWKGDSAWFYTANFRNPIYWFDKSGPLGNTANTYAMYGAGWDSDPVDGGWIWWHSQDDPGTGWPGQVSQYDPATQSFTGLIFGYVPTITVPAMAGGACFYEGFRGADVLFCLVQGTPDAIIGLFIRSHGSIGVEEDEKVAPMVFGLSQNVPNPFTNGQTRIAYATSTSGPVSLKIYDNTGRLVRTLVDAKENAGRKTVHWNGKDNDNNLVAAGVYFYKLTAEGKTASRKIVVVK